MKKRIHFSIALLSGLLLLALAPLAAIDVGATPPDFTVRLADGSSFSLSAMKGKVVLLDFWATWCPPCRAEVPGLVALHQSLQGKKFVILSVSLDRDMDVAKRFIADKKMAWLHLLDKAEGGRISDLYQVEYIPSTFLIDAAGKVSAVSLRGEALKAAVEKLLK
jgi:thiol-disulfide isomerase/thioredoxin